MERTVITSNLDDSLEKKAAQGSAGRSSVVIEASVLERCSTEEVRCSPREEGEREKNKDAFVMLRMDALVVGL